MYNPMTTEYVISIKPNLSSLQQAFLEAVNDFAYETTWPIESRLGEYAGDKYDRDKLVEAVILSIRKLTIDNGGRIGTHRLKLVQAIAELGFHSNTLHCVEKATEEEAIKRIDAATHMTDGKIRYIDHAHHARQYIAANTAENIAMNLHF